jgi:hypothetical protein
LRYRQTPILMVTLLAVSLLAATAAHDELVQCEALLQREMPHDAQYFRIGYRIVRDAPGQYTLHLSYFSSGRWLATCRLAGERGLARVEHVEISAVAALPRRR